jgi:hypothetical protein
MTRKRLLIALGLMSLLAGAGFVARETEGPGLRMAGAAETFLASLDDKQKTKATFAFDDKERTRWFFTPQQNLEKRTPLRKGLPLAEMTSKQKDLARSLIKSATSETSYKKVTTIMSLESILADLEKKGRMVRDPEWYFFTVFGTPSKTGKWGWRVEGHHLSLNFTLDGGQVVSATPLFLGANPALVMAGDRKGLRTLPESDKPFRDLVALLDDDQRKAAKLPKFREIEEAVAKPGVGSPVGIAGEKMTEKQKTALWKLITGYAERLPPEVAAHELAEVKKASLDKVYFAYLIDESRPGKPSTYRVQGPTFVIEYINEQNDSAGNPANHIHSAWRNIKGDFGLAGRADG